MREILARLSNPDALPILGLLLLFPLMVTACLFLGAREDRRRKDGSPSTEKGLPPKVPTWPHLLKRELAAALAVSILLLAWSLLVDAPLQAKADPAVMPNPAKAPWYFLGLQEILVYFDPWIAGVALPLLITFGLASIPYLDPNPGGNGRYTLRERPLALTLFLSGFTLWCLLIAVGTFCRGPGWAWFWPWEKWDPNRAALMTPLRPLPEVLGLPEGLPSFLGGLFLLASWYLLVGLAARAILKKLDPAGWKAFGRGRFLLFVFLAGTMLGVVAKILLHLLADINYILVVPWIPRANI